MGKRSIIFAAITTSVILFTTGCALQGPLPSTATKNSNKDSLPAVSSDNSETTVPAVKPISTPIKIKPEEPTIPGRDSVSDPNDLKSLESLAAKVVASYRTASYLDDKYVGYRNLDLYSLGFQESLKEGAERTKMIITGRKMTIIPYDINVKAEDIQIDEDSAVVWVHYKEKGTDTNKDFDQIMTGRLSFEKIDKKWLVTDVQFDIDHTD
ncbi:hypothetical protein [Paenibacillus sp. Leaf72]|uniref:hypothetical protein n=1 Tax=Paenibacillus sp. Leaf72 TaxID=1736234 RepID=UPI0006F340A1|nr:hypothetical protein [Paenibacillus sp. Leaf72]KQN96891.1 hypothetical protein ASF12_22750 [Paenibacillus sp. Leaf72]